MPSNEINIRELNTGAVKPNPYGKVTQIKPSFKNIDYYDCYIPYALTNERLGGYRLEDTIDTTPGQEDTYPPMADAIKKMRVANYVNVEARYASAYPRPDIQAAISSGKLKRKRDENIHCHYLERNGIQFYEMAVQPFFLRRSVGTGNPTDGFFPYSWDNRGQLVDVILTSGKVIHFILADVNSVAHTNCGSASHNNAHDGFAATSYGQYHNIISAIAGNSIEMLGDAGPGCSSGTSWTSTEDYCNVRFAKTYGLGTWGVNGQEDIAFYRVYNAKVQQDANIEVTESYMKAVSYDIENATSSPINPTSPISPVVIEEKGIFDLQIDWKKWAKGTNLIRLGQYKILETRKEGTRLLWYDITDPNKPEKYTKTQLSNKFGIKYKKVNVGYRGKFEVFQQPLATHLGGTGVSDLTELFSAITGVSNGEYDDTGFTPGTIGEGSIDLPNLGKGHILTAEARTEDAGTFAAGDQGQLSGQLDIMNMAPKAGEVSFVYDRELTRFTNTYRLYSDDPATNTLYRKYALQAANHACYFVQNNAFGYNFGTNQSAIEEYIKNNRGGIQFGKFNSVKADTNCMNLCKLMYMAVMPVTVQSAFNTFWTTAGILNSTLLESIGFRKFGEAYTHNPNNLEIGDIIVFNDGRHGHAAMIVGVGGKDWVLLGTDYNPSLGEVFT